MNADLVLDPVPFRIPAVGRPECADPLDSTTNSQR
jgi:hypothetical protein